MIGGGAVHVRRLQLHLAGSDGCVELDLSSVHNVEHQANADYNLHRTEKEKVWGFFEILTCFCGEMNSISLST